MDHVYFVRPLTDILVDISVNISVDVLVNISADTWPIYRLSVSQYVDQDVSVNVSTDLSTGISAEWWSIYRPTIGRCLGRYSATLGRYADHWLSAEYRSTVGGISVKSLDC